MVDCEFQPNKISTFRKDLKRTAYKYMIPIRGLIELTARCPFNCKMCYVRISNEKYKSLGIPELSADEIIDFVTQARDSGLLHLTLSGGEPLLREDFPEIYKRLTKLGIEIGIISNGYLIDNSLIELFKEFPPYSIRLSLYGASNDTYYRLCGIKNGFDKVSHAIHLLKEANIHFSVGGIIVKENQNDLEQMYEFAREQNIPFSHTIGIAQSARGSDNNIDYIRLNYEDIPKEKLINAHRVKQLYRHHENYLNDCGNYRVGFSLTWDGIMTLCNLTTKPGVNIRNHPFKECWFELNDKLSVLKKPQKCVDCKYESFCKRCPGILASECGAIDNVTEDFCKKAKFMYEHRSIDSMNN